MRIILIVFLFILSACNETSSKKELITVSKQIKYSKTLDIIKNGNSVKVHIFNPDNKTYKRYFLSNDKNAKLPKDYIRIVTPVKSIIALSGTHIGMLSKLNGLNVLVGVMDPKYIYNSTVLNGVENNKIKSYNGEDALSFEALIAAKSDVLMYSGYGKEFPHAKQLHISGTECIPNYEWKENHPLGRAEWIKLFGYLIDKEKEANEYFSNLEKEYKLLKESVKEIKSKPTVFSGNIIGDFWYAPAGESYYAQLFKDAKADYYYSNIKGIGSIQLSMEQILSDNQKTQFWFNPGFPSLNKVKQNTSKAIFFDAYENKNIFCYSKQMHKYWEMSAIEPHHLLSDLINILHPGTIEYSKLYFYSKLE